MGEIVKFSLRARQPPSGWVHKVTLSDNFMSQTFRDGDNTGILLGNASQEGVKRVLIDGEELPADVHVSDITYNHCILAR